MTEQDSRAAEERENDQTAQDTAPGGPRRFDIAVLPGRRASYTRFEIIRVALIVLGITAVLLFVIAEWLALQPGPDSAASIRSTSISLLSATPDPYTPIPSSATPTSRSAPTRTRRPTATATRTLVPTVTRKPTPAATESNVTPTPLPAPDLVDPHDGATPTHRTVFRWFWSGPPLEDNQAFDLRIWSAEEEKAGDPRRGAVIPTQDLYAEVDLQFVPAIQDYGPGDYYWTVVVVQTSPTGPGRVVGEWGENRRFVFH
ncbi:MAG: hypothetical protein PVI80_14600 [Anaerolineae bacterium]